MTRISTFTRLSLGLVLLTLSIIFSAYLLGLIPDKAKLELAKRQAICESLAVLCSKTAEKNDMETLAYTIKAFVERNDSVLSAALRKPDGTIPVVAGNHVLHWKGAHTERSHPTHVRVPIYSENQIWGHIEVSFQRIYGNTLKDFILTPTIKLILFIILAGFLIYRFFLSRVLKHLDPTSVVPPRVRQALDTMVEGIVMLDNDERIVLANEAFRTKIAKSQTSLTGSKLDRLNLKMPSTTMMPWTRTLKSKERQIGVPLYSSDKDSHQQVFMVNTSPITDSNGINRGALVTFDDVTQIEEKNTQLNTMVEQLERYSIKIKQQNKKLEYLATCDPLTGCRNRRSFFEIFEREFSSAKRYRYPISCIMFDIDHFKSINDNHGHMGGDEVLRGLSGTVKSLVRKMDIVCRYGGEEFCIVLPHIDLYGAAEAAERFRAAVEAQNYSGITVTASFGVSSIRFGASEPASLIDQADKALYAAKESGRNRVRTWKDVAPEADLKNPSPSAIQGPSNSKENADFSRKPEDTVLHENTKEENDRPGRQSVSNPDLGEMPNRSDENTAAYQWVYENLSEASKESNAIGMYAAVINDGSAAVQINGNGGWGDTPPDKNARKPIDKRSILHVAKILRARH
ncbi:MAG: diguanylate cyclase [Desulfatitalea sp.]|nr:diguanylate cyclase [Desulfatitalea sp.]